MCVSDIYLQSDSMNFPDLILDSDSLVFVVVDFSNFDITLILHNTITIIDKGYNNTSNIQSANICIHRLRYASGLSYYLNFSFQYLLHVANFNKTATNAFIKPTIKKLNVVCKILQNSNFLLIYDIS